MAARSILPNRVEFSSETDDNPQQFAPDADAGGGPLPSVMLFAPYRRLINAWARRSKPHRS
jgi:hypothetical protein